MTPAAWFMTALGAALCGAVLSAVQGALRTVTRVALEDIVNPKRHGSGDEKPFPAQLESILDDLPGHTAAVAVPRVVCNLVVGIASVLWISGLRGSTTVALVDVVAGVLVSGVVIWLTGVVLPLALAEHAAARVVALFAPFVRALAVVLAPLRAMVAFTDEVVRRLAGGPPRHTPEAREAELLSLVEESEREGDLDEAEREMIEAVVEFRSTTVEQIMTPRTEIQGIEYTDDFTAVKKAARSTSHSRVPVYDESLDSIVGVLYLKDLLRWLISDDTQPSEFC
ncbi:MAG TPA: DUF21 domain-containing protein, partial [Phycisphaerales bacterium]|nr:DUF21 domain-containing protein [Phycisphaerales bacterium]